MPSEWQTLSTLANTLTVVSVLVIGAYLMVSNKVHTASHTEDVVDAVKDGCEQLTKALEANNAQLREELGRAVAREEAARRELAENTQTLARLETTIRGALDALSRRR